MGRTTPVCGNTGDYITSLDAAGHPDQEARAVIQRQVDVEDVVGCDSDDGLDEGGGPHALVSDHRRFRQT